jgi:hypothetical protein
MFKPSSKKFSKRERKHGSFAFFWAIPCTFTLAVIALATSLSLLSRLDVDRISWALFAHSFIMGGAILAGRSLQRLKTLIHELKHVVVVILSGNKFKDIEVSKDSGQVSYEVYESTSHMEPFVILAPYYWPLFSLPVLCASIAAEVFYSPDSRLPFTYALGFTLAIDLISSYQEIHPWQSDLKRIFGGFFTTRAFIFSFNLMWSAMCLLWIIAGWHGYWQAVELTRRVVSVFLER